MTKFDVMEEKISKRRQERLDEEFNRRLSLRLQTKTHEEVVQELFQNATFIFGVGNIALQNQETPVSKTLVF